jgi:hypothetical protein
MGNILQVHYSSMRMKSVCLFEQQTAVSKFTASWCATASGWSSHQRSKILQRLLLIQNTDYQCHSPSDLWVWLPDLTSNLFPARRFLVRVGLCVIFFGGNKYHKHYITTIWSHFNPPRCMDPHVSLIVPFAVFTLIEQPPLNPGRPPKIWRSHRTDRMQLLPFPEILIKINCVLTISPPSNSICYLFKILQRESPYVRT